jgi:hypothetical protein
MNAPSTTARAGKKTAVIIIAALGLLIFFSKTVYFYNLPEVSATRPFRGVLNKLEIAGGIASWAEQETVYAERGGVIGAVFSFVDKLFTQLNNVVVGLLMVLIGFGGMYPTTSTPLTPALFWAGMFCLCGLPALAWVINIICMRFYPLDRVRMEEVQQQIAERRIESLEDQ